MKRQRREDWMKNGSSSPPPNRVPASPYGDENDFYHSSNVYDSEDGSPSKSRRDRIPTDDACNSSTDIADAEDFVKTINGGISIGKNGRYQSFTMESPPPKRNEGNLHHRHHHNHHNNNTMTPAEKHSRSNGANDYDDESPQHRLMRQRAYLTPRKIEHHQDKHYKPYKGVLTSVKSWSAVKIARWSLGFGLVFYLAILTRSMYYLGENPSMTIDDFDAPTYIWDQPRRHCAPGSTRGVGCQQIIPSWYEEQWKQMEGARLTKEAHQNRRKSRTKPAPRSESTETNDWHRVLSLDTSNNSEIDSNSAQNLNSRKDNKGGDAPASKEDLCGMFAKTSSAISPQSYTSRTALNKQSKVVISGVLNPVGLSLALRLKQECGVQHVMGVDAMFPNTVGNRIELQDRIELLNSNSQGSVSTKPIILSYFGLDSTKKGKQKQTPHSELQDELDWMQSFQPTHVVHLSSYSIDAYNDALIAPEWKNSHSPYVSNSHGDGEQAENPFFYPLRSGMVSMEQLLQTIARFPVTERPQVLYVAKPLQSNKTPDTHDKIFSTMKQADELLATTYDSGHENGLPSIGMRLPNAIYGPWGHSGSTTHEILVDAVEKHSGSISSRNPRIQTTGSKQLELLFIDDAVNGIISAMQYKPEKATTVTIPAESTTSIENLSSAVHSLLHADTNGELIGIDTVQTNLNNDREQSLILPEREQTPLKDGLIKSIAWHMDRATPFGSAPVSAPDTTISVDVKPIETGDKFLQRHEMETCEPYDISCHKNFDYLPCNSECNTHQNCVPSIFDNVRELIYNVSEGCDVAMYTQMLGFNVKDAELHAEYMDDSDLDDDELLVCNFAFVPRESDLVSMVSNKVPNEQLAKYGIEPKDSDKSSKDLKDRKLDTLNGRLLYRGWILIWVEDGMEDLSAPDASLLKLSPSKFFHPTVKYGLFVEDNFKVSPNLEDVLFLVDQMHRKKLEDRTLKKQVTIETPNGPLVTKKKFRIPAEPARRAAILFSPLRFPNIDDPLIEKFKSGEKKLTLAHASKFMRFEVGYKSKDKESPSLRRQREFYERIPSYINKRNELRSPFEPWYQFSMRHWVRSRWVLHDFTLEESRLLRCDWYQEHLQWGNDLDQLSFAKVMAMREIKRRIAHQEPDDHVKTFIQQHPELHALTDSYEWHDMETEVNKLYRDPLNWDPHRLPSKLKATAEEVEEVPSTEETPIYVRIMSERVMDISRKIWNKMRKKLAKAKKQKKKA